MTTVVTGAAGHVGGNLVRALLEQGREVRGLVRQDTRALEGLAIERVAGNTLDRPSLDRAFAGADTVFNLAARISIVGDEGGLVHQTNVEGVRNVVAACLQAGVKKLVHFSSIHAFHQVPLDQPLTEIREGAKANAPAYDRSKIAGEAEVRAGVAQGLPAVIVNPTAIIGPNDFKPSRMGQVILDLCHKRFPALVEGGFNWVDVRDVVAGALAAEQKGRVGERYLLSGEWLSVADLAALVEKHSGTRVPRWAAPMWLARVGAPFVSMYSHLARKTPLFTNESLHALRSNRLVSSDKAREELGYQPRPLSQTVEDTISWFRQQGKISQ